VQDLRQAAASLASARPSAPVTDRDRLAQLNAALFRVERAMLAPDGLPGREWYRHLFYAPGFYTGYDAKTLPGLREAIDLKQWDLARQQSEVLRKAIVAVTQEVSQAARLLR
jgi:N-acetylated-alpha-linked acidic dipeptidase